MQKIEGHLAFHTAASTAFPQPKPGTAPAPGPMTVPAGQLRGLLGITRASYVPAQGSLAIIDTPLDAEMAASSDSETDGRNHRPGGSI